MDILVFYSLAELHTICKIPSQEGNNVNTNKVSEKNLSYFVSIVVHASAKLVRRLKFSAYSVIEEPQESVKRNYYALEMCKVRDKSYVITLN